MSLLRIRHNKALAIACLCILIALTVLLTLVIRNAIYERRRYNDCLYEPYFAEIWAPDNAVHISERDDCTVYSFTGGVSISKYIHEDGAEELVYKNPNNGCLKIYYNHVLTALGVGEFHDSMGVRYKTYPIRDIEDCARIYTIYGGDSTERIEDGYMIFQAKNGEVFID